MSRNENPPFQVGTTPGATATTDMPEMEGREWLFEDLDYSAVGNPPRTNRLVLRRIVRNIAGIALLPKRLCAYANTAAGLQGNQVDGYVTTTAARIAGVVDEFLPTTGVADKDLFWITRDGPSLVLPDLAAGANNVINIGTVLVALTAVTSQSTTAGRVAPQDLTGATALLANQVQNRLGTALTARTTANTTLDVLVDVHCW